MLPTLTSTLANAEDKPGDGYPFRSLWINGRNISLESLLYEKDESRTPFEESTFNFLKDWFSGQQTFDLTTSGSTGTPKSVSVPRSRMIASAQRTAQKLNLQKHSTALVGIDTKYIAGKMMLVRSLITGLRIMALDPEANPLVKIPVDKWVQFTAFVPYQINAILESKHPHLLNNLEKVLIGGAPLNEASTKELDRFQCECYETYGMTETVSHIALRLINTKNKQQYFEALPGVDISQDARGCLVISADYLGDPVVTNDIVDLAGPGRFLWLGRWDSVINTGGVKVIPERIETKLETIFRTNDFHHRFFIAALPDEKLGNKIILVLEGVQFSSEIPERLVHDLRAAITAYEMPKEVYSAPEFATTETQKIDRKKTLSGVTLLSAMK